MKLRNEIGLLGALGAAFVLMFFVPTQGACTKSCATPVNSDQCSQCCADGSCGTCCTSFTTSVKQAKCRGFCDAEGKTAV